MAKGETTLDDLPRRRGKVRDIYDLGDRLLLVASDRISAYDWVLPTPVPDKGRVLAGLIPGAWRKTPCRGGRTTCAAAAWWLRTA